MTIFDNIVYNENSFTELFKNYMRYKTFRDQFISLIGIVPPNIIIDFEHFTTQVSSNNCRPDMRISSENVEVFIEIKVWNTRLTENQPLGYIKELEKVTKQYKALILIIPNHYKYIFEYNRRNKEYSTTINKKIIHWDDIIKFIEENEIHQGNPMISEFLELLKEWFEPKKININSDFIAAMNNKQTPESINNLVEIITQLNTEVTKRGFITRKKNNFLEEYGFYVENDKFSLFIGEWFHYWQNEGKPLCISLQTQEDLIYQLFKEQCNSFSNESPKYFNNEWLTIGISIDTDFNIKVVLENLYNLITILNNNSLN